MMTLLISDLDSIAPAEAAKIRAIAWARADEWDCPYYLALDYVLLEIDKRMSEKIGETFVPNDTSCRLYERGRETERIE